MKNLINLSELQLKEVVLLESGRKLGLIADFDIDDRSGAINALIVSTKQAGGNLFNRMTETVIPWQQIVIIGDDIILVNEAGKIEKVKKEVKTDENE